MISSFNPVFISLNCSRPELILQALDVISNFPPFGVYPNLGSVESFNSGKLVRDFSSDALNQFVNEIIKKKCESNWCVLWRETRRY